MNDGRQDDERVDSGPEEMYEDLPPYAPASSLDSSQLRRALTDLNLSGRTLSRRCSRPRPPSTQSVRWRCAPSCAEPAKAGCGTSSSPATTTSDTRPWSAPRCATPSTTATAGRWPCSAFPPPPGSSPRATSSSGGRRNFARRTSPWWSTTRSHETHEPDPMHVVEADDKPVPVPADVEYDPVVAEDARVSVHRLHIRWRRPVRFRRDRVPRLQRLFCSGLSFPIGAQRPLRDDPHDETSISRHGM